MCRWCLVLVSQSVSTMWYPVLTFFTVCALTYVLKKLNQDGPNNIRYNFNYFLFYWVTSVVSGCLWPYFLLKPKNVHNSKFGASILKHVTKVIGVQWCLRNGDVLAEDRGAVIISNHQNALDILGMFNIWEVIDRLAAIAKKELFYVWPFGLSAYLAGVVFIDRRDSSGAYKQLHITSDIMVKKKTKIWIFPEGTRNKDYTKLLPFKKGAFHTAVAAQVPIIPVVFSPYYFVNRQKHIFNKGHVIIKCLDAVPTTGLTADDVPVLTEQIHHKMTIAYKELSKEVLNTLPEDYPYSLKG